MIPFDIISLVNIGLDLQFNKVTLAYALYVATLFSSFLQRTVFGKKHWFPVVSYWKDKWTNEFTFFFLIKQISKHISNKDKQKYSQNDNSNQ